MRPIITMTSWRDRIDNVPTVVDSLYRNNTPPEFVVLNLSTDEFPYGLPKDLENYCYRHKVMVLWDPNNRKVWKKILPTISAFPNKPIICVDDDFIYPPHFIETLWEPFQQDSSTPLTGITFHLDGKYQQFSGCSSIFTSKHFGDVYKVLIDHPEIYSMKSSDTFFMCMTHIAGNPVRYCGRKIRKELTPFNDVSSWSAGQGVKNSMEMLNYMRKLYPQWLTK